MTPEERKAIIHRPWTYEEACEARDCIQGLMAHGEWQSPPTEAMVMPERNLGDHI